MSRVDQVRESVQAAQRANADLLYRHTLVWSDGTSCRASVQDLNRTSTARRLASAFSTDVPLVTDARILRVHPDDPLPGEGATTPWDGGSLLLDTWTQRSDFTGQALGLCRLRR